MSQRGKQNNSSLTQSLDRKKKITSLLCFDIQSYLVVSKKLSIKIKIAKKYVAFDTHPFDINQHF